MSKLKTQIVVVAESFEAACDALAILGGDINGRRLQGLLESSCGVSIDYDEGQKVWLQQAGADVCPDDFNHVEEPE